MTRLRSWMSCVSSRSKVVLPPKALRSPRGARFAEPCVVLVQMIPLTCSLGYARALSLLCHVFPLGWVTLGTQSLRCRSHVFSSKEHMSRCQNMKVKAWPIRETQIWKARTWSPCSLGSVVSRVMICTLKLVDFCGCLCCNISSQRHGRESQKGMVWNYKESRFLC